MKVLNFDTETKWFFIVGLFLFYLVAKEALTVPLTHDEYNTIACSQTSIWDIITYKDPVPNNHILNTLMIKLNISLFGDHLFTNRLHNFLFFIPFYIFTVLISRLLFREVWLRISLVGLIILQPFLLDFFAVARGYGLSVAFQVISIYYFIKRMSEGGHKNLFKTLVWSAVGVYANFTLLNYFVPLMFILTVDSFKRWYRVKRLLMWKEVGIIFGIGSVLGLFTIIPLLKMIETKQFVYWGSNGFFVDTVKQLILSMRSGVDYFGSSNEIIYGLVLVFVCAILLVGGLLSFRQKEKGTLIYFYCLLLLIVIYNQTQFYLLDVPFLNARTALFFIPVVSIAFCLGLEYILYYSRFVALVLFILINSLVLQHFIRGYNIKVIHEWYYDTNTYEVLDYIKNLVETGQAPKPVKVNCYWIFYPSMKYHIDHGYIEFIEMAPFDTKIENDQVSQYYYTESGEKDKLSSKFESIKDFGNGGRFILKSKGR